MNCGLAGAGSRAVPHVVGRRWADENAVDGAVSTIPTAAPMAMPERQDFAQVEDKLVADDFGGYNLLVGRQRPLE